MYRNEPIYVLVNDPTDYTALGASPEESAKIVREGWSVVNAPRPLATSWWPSRYHYEPGLRWDAPGILNAWFFAAGDPEGNVNVHLPDRTLLDSWNADDASPVVLVDLASLEQLAADLFDADERDEYIAAYREMDGDDWPLEAARNMRLRVFDRRSA